MKEFNFFESFCDLLCISLAAFIGIKVGEAMKEQEYLKREHREAVLLWDTIQKNYDLIPKENKHTIVVYVDTIPVKSYRDSIVTEIYE